MSVKLVNGFDKLQMQMKIGAFCVIQSMRSELPSFRTSQQSTISHIFRLAVAPPNHTNFRLGRVKEHTHTHTHMAHIPNHIQSSAIPINEKRTWQQQQQRSTNECTCELELHRFDTRRTVPRSFVRLFSLWAFFSVSLYGWTALRDVVCARNLK